MDPTRFLEVDHRRAAALFEAIAADDGDRRTALVDDLASLLRAHMELEELLLYPAMAPVTGSQAVGAAEGAHAEARRSLRNMIGLAPDEPGFDDAVAATRAAYERHIREEENELFPELRQDGTLLRRLAAEFVEARVDLGLPMDADALAAASTKDELLVQAQTAEVIGAPSMDKAELAEAVADSVRGIGSLPSSQGRRGRASAGARSAFLRATGHRP